MSTVIRYLNGLIRDSRWFTRGWTLQELIAPPLVQFYDKKWTSLGAKQYLCEVLAEITSIGVDVLKDRKSLRRLSVAKRMSFMGKIPRTALLSLLNTAS